LKLRGHLRKHQRGVVMLSDATRPPVKDRSVDVVLCTFLAHHLSEQDLAMVLSESRRILKQTGFLLFMDPIWQPSRWRARLLWKYDRGTVPRTGANLLSAVSEYFRIVGSQQFTIHHEYILLVGMKHPENPLEVSA
jgi:ubiquinone/menaquinone biosynthesis C-methylase UbiE